MWVRMINSPLPEGGKGAGERAARNILVHWGTLGVGQSVKRDCGRVKPTSPHVSKHELRRTGGSVSILDLSFAPLRGVRGRPAWRGRWVGEIFMGTQMDGWMNQSHYCFPHGVRLIINWIKATRQLGNIALGKSGMSSMESILKTR